MSGLYLGPARQTPAGEAPLLAVPDVSPLLTQPALTTVSPHVALLPGIVLSAVLFELL